MAIVGFDFGTTNSLISVVRKNRAINFLDEEQRPIPSVVCYEGATKIVGREAKQRLGQAGLGVQGNVVRSPKMLLDRDSVYVEGVGRNPVEMVADVVRHVLQLAMGRGQDLGQVGGAVVTIPVDMDGRRRRALRAAFQLAGVRIEQFVHEPLAALYGMFKRTGVPEMLRRYDRKLILVFDWGGGTLDLTLCRPMGDTVVQLMNDGTDEVGGDTFDQAIMNLIVQRVMEKRGFEESVGTQPGASSRLVDRCERAKIELSSRGSTQIYVSSYFNSAQHYDLDYRLGRDELEAIVKPLLDKGFQRIERILTNAGYAPEQVALCVATGGMSNMPAVRRRLHEWFGPERVQIPDGTATLIAEGAAWIANDRVDLHLAKNVELELARGSFLPLVKAGTLMPREGTVQRESFHLYCTDPRDGHAKFQICSPKRVGRAVLPGEPRDHLENLTVKVDAKAHAFAERLELDVQIDDNLVLKVDARSLNQGDREQCEVHNLEFGLKLSRNAELGQQDDEETEAPPARVERRAHGSLTVRANISDREDLSLVPGEFLYQYNRPYFDRRHNTPEHQLHEKLYYQPCSLCGRASHDPACRCLTAPPVHPPIVRGGPDERRP